MDDDFPFQLHIEDIHVHRGLTSAVAVRKLVRPVLGTSKQGCRIRIRSDSDWESNPGPLHNVVSHGGPFYTPLTPCMASVRLYVLYSRVHHIPVFFE